VCPCRSFDEQLSFEPGVYNGEVVDRVSFRGAFAPLAITAMHAFLDIRIPCTYKTIGMSCAADMNCDTEASPEKLILDRTLILFIGTESQISTRNLGISSCHLRTTNESENAPLRV
jgi:hypothetical protein